jgi:GNAT superfamily N-acetyltransferase
VPSCPPFECIYITNQNNGNKEKKLSELCVTLFLILAKTSPLPNITYKKGNPSDVPAMARIRAAEWETEPFWIERISGYMAAKLHPQRALIPRVVFIALQNETVIGFVAGHLTQRYDCDAELQWINVIPAFRGTGVAKKLLWLLSEWFTEQKASKVCVDAGNPAARRFYLRHGAEDLNEHWLVWHNINMLLKDELEK